MKKNFLTLAIILISALCFGQIKPIEEINGEMSQGTNRGFKVLIPHTSKKDALKAWERLMKEYDAKTSKVKKEEDYLSAQANVPSISDRAVDVYSNFDETPEGTYLKVYLNLGSAYLNSDMHGDKAIAVKEVIKSYANKTAQASIQKKVTKEEKHLARLEKEQKGLEKAKTGLQNDIKQAKETIEKSEKAITENDVSQKKKNAEIVEQKKAADDIKAVLQKFK